MIEEKYGEDLDEDLDLDELKSYLQQNSNSDKASELNNVSPAMIMPQTNVKCMQDRWKEFENEFITANVLNAVYANLNVGELWKEDKNVVKTDVDERMIGVDTELKILW